MILVLCEVDPATGEVDEVSLESLALARSLGAAAGSDVCAAGVGPVPDPAPVAAVLGRHGAVEVRQWLVERNAHARAFHESLGFVPTGAERPYEPSPDIREVELRLPLSS